MDNNRLRLDLTQIEYDTLSPELQGLIPTKTPFWENPHPADPLVVLIDELSAIGDMFHFYIEQRTNEMILTRAQRKKSVIDLGKVFDFHLSRPITTAYKAQVQIKSNHSNTTSPVQTLPVGTQFRSNRNSFYLQEQVAADFTNPISVTIYEGVYRQETFSLLPLDLNQKVYKIPLTYPDISQNFFILTIDGVLWEEEVFSPSIQFNKNKYLVETDEEGYSTIVFNGYKYNLPQDSTTYSPNSTKVQVYYVSTTGIEGQIADPSEISTFDLPSSYTGTDFSGEFNTFGAILSVPFTEEADWREAKNKVSSFFSTLWRAVSLNDYEKLTSTLSQIQSAKATRKDNADNRHTAQIWIKSYGDYGPPNPLIPLTSLTIKDDVQQFLIERSCVGAGVEVYPALEKDFYLVLEVRVLSRTPQVQVRSDLTTTCQSLSNSLTVGETLTVDTVYDTLSQVLGVVSLKINRMSYALDNTVAHLEPQDKEILRLKGLVINLSTVGVAQ